MPTLAPSIDEIQKGAPFSDALLEELRSKIACVDGDPSGKRIYFENAGGSLTLKECCRIADTLSEIPDFPNRPTPGATPLQQAINQGLADCKLIFGASGGAILADLTVSKAIHTMTGVIMGSKPGKNVVTTNLEHPATFDACHYHAKIFGSEVRAGVINQQTGSVDMDDLLRRIDGETVLLSMIHASNITGTLNDVETIVREARKINPEIYVLLDSTQHVPHGSVDVEALGIDAAGFAPYKIMGKRGLGIGWVSDRVAELHHPRFYGSSETEWDLGGYEPAGLSGISVAVDYICDIGRHFSEATQRRELYVAGMHAIELQERSIIYRILHGSPDVPGINDIEGVKIHFIDDLTKRDCILPMTFDNISTQAAVDKYVRQGIYVYHRSAGNKMSKRVMDGVGIKSLVRIAPMHYNTQAEIDEFLRVTSRIAREEI